ncbi:MAG: substrate-binding domain-containing protein [Enterobacteriaceae bacterium]
MNWEKICNRVSAAILLLLSLMVGTVQSAEKYKIGVAVYGLKGEFMQMWVNELKAHPMVKNGTVAVTVFDGNYDALTQNNQFDTMITQKFDAILFVPIDIEAGSEAVEKAIAANIPVVGSNTRVTTEKLTAYVGNNDEKAGELQAEAIAKAIGGKGNIVILEGPIGQSAQIERTAGNQKVLSGYPDIKVLMRKPANWSRAESITLMENWLTTWPDKINAIIGQNDDIALGALEAVKARGIAAKSMPTAGIDGIADAMVAIKNGELMVSYYQDAKAQAQGALDVALHHLIGDSYQPQSQIWQDYAAEMPWNGGKEKIYEIPWTQITPENADQFLKKIGH